MGVLFQDFRIQFLFVKSKNSNLLYQENAVTVWRMNDCFFGTLEMESRERKLEQSSKYSHIFQDSFNNLQIPEGKTHPISIPFPLLPVEISP